MAIEELSRCPGIPPGEPMLKVVPNTVRNWLRRGEEAPPPIMGRRPVLKEVLPWVRKRFLEGTRNSDVLRQELAEQDRRVSLRTVERATAVLRQETRALEQATLRFETEPGRQLQVDFGECWLEVGGVRVKVFVFVATLGFSRRTYLRLYPGTRQAYWLDGLDGCLRHFGGIPREFLVDNARALVLRWKDDEPVFHPEFLAFCDYYGIRPRACRPYRARTKGKVESGVKYVKRNALGRRNYANWDALEAHLAWWTREVADQRIHGTTHERPAERFLREAPMLKPLMDVAPYQAVQKPGPELSNQSNQGCPQRDGGRWRLSPSSGFLTA